MKRKKAIKLCRKMGMPVRVVDGHTVGWDGEELTIGRERDAHLVIHELGHWLVAKQLDVSHKENYGIGDNREGSLVHTIAGAYSPGDIEYQAMMAASWVTRVVEALEK